tara:strand:- start:19578 stop:20318 length:741 start_codon:yes stop_codon:yes gene_type:complete
VNYDAVAPAYDRRYETNRLDGVEAVLRRFIGKSECADVAEVGCGTGHWLAKIRNLVRRAAGLDLSAEMLDRARIAAPDALVVRGRAEQLPWTTGRFDLLYCVNALHHFGNVEAFLAEARRVLRPHGAFMTIGLDPHTNLDTWWIYDYFPTARQADRGRYLPTSTIRGQLEAHGFMDAATTVAHHVSASVPFATALERGMVDRCAASQFMVVSDTAYEEGLRRLRAEQPVLHADLRLYVTFARALSS